MSNILDPLFNGMPASEFYRHQLLPDLFPGKEMLFHNWCFDDLVMFVGGKYAFV